MKDFYPNMLGIYGPWAKSVFENGPGAFSFLRPEWNAVAQWKQKARAELMRLMAPPPAGEASPEVTVARTYHYDGLIIEELVWRLPFGPPTEALFIKPAKTEKSAGGPKSACRSSISGKLPGVLALHDHGGIKKYGKQKITRTGETQHPLMWEHQALYYGGRPWANELAKRGYGVLVHDVFPFESRKILPSQLPGHVVRRMMTPPLSVEEVRPEDAAASGAVKDFDDAGYDAFAAQHEHIIAKSLFCMGLTWPGTVLAEDLFALDYLASRPDIDASRIGCCGLSGGGLRTNYLAGLDERIRCSVTAGFMTTWKDLCLDTCYTHTWMIYVPGLAVLMDFPDILSMHAPKPTLVLATDNDPLFSLEEVKKASGHVEAVYWKAGAPAAFRFSLYPGLHKFDEPMQAEAFDWLDAWLV